MSEAKKFLYSFILSFVILIMTALFYKSDPIIIPALIVLSFLMFLGDYSKNNILLYFSIFILGPFSEALMIYFGGWHYSTPQIFGFPFYLPFVWGSAALFVKRLNLYIGYILKRKRLHGKNI